MLALLITLFSSCWKGRKRVIQKTSRHPYDIFRNTGTCNGIRCDVTIHEHSSIIFLLFFPLFKSLTINESVRALQPVNAQASFIPTGMLGRNIIGKSKCRRSINNNIERYIWYVQILFWNLQRYCALNATIMFCQL